MAVFRGVTVGTTLTLDKGKWSRDLREAKAEMKAWRTSATQSADQAHAHFSRLSSMMGRAFRMSAIAGGTGVAIGLGAAVRAGTQFDQVMSRVKALTDANTKQFAALRNEALMLGARTSFSAKQAADAMTNLGAAGLKTTQIIAAMPGVLDAAAASGEDMASVSAIMTNTMYGFGLAAGKTAHIADVLAHAANDTQASIGDMGETFKYAGAPAKALGVSLEQVAAMADLMAKNGVKASQAGTSIRMGLLQLAMDERVIPTRTLDKLERISPALTKIWASSQPVPAKLAAISAEMQGMDRNTKVAAARLIFGAQAVTGMLAVVDAGPAKLRKLAGDFKTVDGEAHRMGLTMRDNVAGAFENFKGSLETAGITLNDMFKGNVKGVLQGAAGWFNNITLALKNQGPYALQVHDTMHGIKSLLGGLKDGLEGAAHAFASAFQGAAGFENSTSGATLSLKEFLSEVGDAARTVLPLIGQALGTVTGVLAGHKDAVIGAVAAYAAFRAISVGGMLQGLYAQVQLAAVAWGEYAAANEGASLAQWSLNRAIMANPVGLIAGAIAIGVGALVAWKLHSDNAHTASDGAAESNRRFLKSINAIRDANLQSRDASFTYVDSVHREAAAANVAAAAHRKYLKSHDPRDLKAWNEAQYEAARATAQRRGAEAQLGDTMKGREKESVNLRKTLDTDRQKYAESAAHIRAFQDAIKAYAKAEHDTTRQGFIDRQSILGDIEKTTGARAQSRDDLIRLLGDEQRAHGTYAHNIEKGESQLRDSVKQSQGDMRLILKNTGSVKPEFREYTQGVIDNMRKAGLITDQESAKIKRRLEKGLDDARPDAKNVGPNFQTALEKIFGGLKIPKITVPINAAINWLAGKGDGIGVGGLPHGVKASLGPAAGLAEHMGLHISAGKDDHGKYVKGTNRVSMHYLGRALDFVGSPSQMRAFALAADRIPHTELFYDPLGGKFQIGGHSDHVHFALATGGMIPGSALGDRHPALLESGEGVLNRNATSALGGRRFVDWANAKWPRHSEGTYVDAIGAAQTRLDRPISYLQGLEKADVNRLKATYTNERTWRKEIPALTSQLHALHNAEDRLAHQIRHLPADRRHVKQRKNLQDELDAVRAKIKHADAKRDADRRALGDLPEQRRTISDEIVALRAEIAEKIAEGSDTSGASTDPAGAVIDPATGEPIAGSAPGPTIAELMAQMHSLATSMNQAFQSETGNVFGGVRIEKNEQHFQTPVGPDAALEMLRFKVVGA